MNPQDLQWLLLLEALLFFLANLCDFYLTNAMVRRYGPEVEANPHVRRMYATGNFRPSHLFLLAIGLVYGLLLGFSLVGNVNADYWIAIIGLVGLCFPAWNLFRGGMIFYRLRRPTAPAPLSS